MSKSTDPKFEFRRVKFVEAEDGSKTGGLEPTIGFADKIEVNMLNDNGRVRTHLFDLDKEQENLAEWIVQVFDYNADSLPDVKIRTCCGFMDPVELEHCDCCENPRQHRDIFECPRCLGKEASSEWVDCDCPEDKPEYEPEDRLTNPFFDNLF